MESLVPAAAGAAAAASEAPDLFASVCGWVFWLLLPRFPWDREGEAEFHDEDRFDSFSSLSLLLSRSMGDDFWAGGKGEVSPPSAFAPLSSPAVVEEVPVMAAEEEEGVMCASRVFCLL